MKVALLCPLGHTPVQEAIYGTALLMAHVQVFSRRRIFLEKGAESGRFSCPAHGELTRGELVALIPAMAYLDE